MYDVVALRKALKKIPVGYKVKMNLFGKLSLYDRGGKYKGYVDPKHSTMHLGYQPISKGQKRMAKLLVVLISASIAASMLQGCSFGVYSGDKSTLVGVEVGTKSAFEGLAHHRDADNFDLTIESSSKDSSLDAIVEGIVRGMKP